MEHQGLHEAWLPRGVNEPPGRRAGPRFAGEQWEEGRGQPRVTEEGWGSPRRRQDRLGALGEVQFVAAAISAFPFARQWCWQSLSRPSFMDQLARASNSRCPSGRTPSQLGHGDGEEVFPFTFTFSASPLSFLFVPSGPSLSFLHSPSIFNSILPPLPFLFPFPFRLHFSHPQIRHPSLPSEAPRLVQKRGTAHAVRSVSLLDRAKCTRVV